MLLAGALLMVALSFYLVRGRAPSSVGVASPAVTPGQAPDRQASSDVLATPDDSGHGETASPPAALVDPRGQVVSVAPESPLNIPDRWGIEITNVRLAAGGKALDLRYKVLDVAKAASLLYLTNYVYIFNHSNKKVLMVPFQRENQTSQKLVAGKTYFTLLPNKEERVTSGSTVTVVVGGSRAENLFVN